MYQAFSDITNPIRAAAKVYAPLFEPPWWPGAKNSLPARLMRGACDVVALAGLSHERPSFGIDVVAVRGKDASVREEIIETTPFCSLVHFKKDLDLVQPRVLVVAPVSGHFSTLLRNTIRTLLIDHDVYMTDWHNARDIPLSAGRFNLDDFITHVIHSFETLGPGVHLVAVCQPTVPALAAVALMAEDNNPAQPTTMTLLAGPIDTRIQPTEVNILATSKPIEWFENNVITTVPLRYRGAMRKVYPGFLQISAFMAMNIGRHVNSFVEYYAERVRPNDEKAESIRVFYEEYFAMMDLPAEFYIQTVKNVFQEHQLARGVLHVNDRLVDCSKIKKTALFTIEGERDDICSIGQTLAAQELCSGIRENKKKHHVQMGVGHYGVFSGRRWENEIYPLVRDFIHLYNK
jgi:polyhydroxyalkanoate depolymerase